VGKSLFRVVAALVALLIWSTTAHAAGLGKLTVVSTLGQPFRSEIDLVSVKKDELSSLSARLASPDAFKQADLPYTAYVSNLKLTIEKRANGEPYVKVSAYQPLNEPFIDFLIELSWTSGRLVRAYTALVDPPVVSDSETAKAPEVKPMPLPVETAVAPSNRAARESAPATEPERAPPQSAPDSMQAQVPPETAPAEPLPVQRSEGGLEVPEPAVQTGGARATPSGGASATRATASGGEIVVKQGDTLSKIAKANKAQDLSLEQMLVLLYRENSEAFAGKNMNRLKTGKVLRLPDASTPVDVTQLDARKEVRVQAANWNAYREKLASVASESPPIDTGAQQSAAGKVTTTVQEKTPAADAPKEVLKLSKGEPAKAGTTTGQEPKDAKGMQDRIRSLEEEIAAKNKSITDSGERVAVLEKTVKDMQALMEIKNKGMSDLQKPAADLATTVPAKPESPTSAVEAPAIKPAVEPAPPVVAQAPMTASGPATVAPAPVEEAPQPTKRFVPPPPPSFVDQLLENPLYLAAGAAVLAVLGFLSYTVVKRRRAGGSDSGADNQSGRGGNKNSTRSPEDEVTEEIPSAAALAGAGRASGDVHEEGDPLAEAEIFLTYGRDSLAEERLKEAIASTPKRYELHGKLLEIYAGRRDSVAFEQVAKEIQIGTGGKGEIWNKAARLGHQLDPQNPRYASGRPTDEEGVATVVAGAGALALAAAAANAPRRGSDAAKTNLDFNLGFDDSAIGTTTDIDLGRLGQEFGAAGSTSTDFDLGALDDAGVSDENMILDPGARMPGVDNESTVQLSAFEGTAPLPREPAAPAGLDFDFDVSAIAPPAEADMSTEAPADDDGLNFDISGLDLDMPAEPGGGQIAAAPDLDLSGISLDLGNTETPAAAGGKDDKWYDVQTKFDLAKAYQEMGDREGAREILQEVLAEGDAEQKAAAQAVLGSLG